VGRGAQFRAVTLWAEIIDEVERGAAYPVGPRRRSPPSLGSSSTSPPATNVRRPSEPSTLDTASASQRCVLKKRIISRFSVL
jgi:hypothetical protein